MKAVERSRRLQYDMSENREMDIRKSTAIRSIVAFFAIALIITAGFVLTFKISDASRENYFKERKTQVTAAAAAVNVDDVLALAGDESDEDNPAFQRLRAQLVRIKQSDPDVRFVYLMGPRDDRLIFLADAEDTSSKDYSPPGQVYEEATPEDIAVFNTGSSPAVEIEEPQTDRWGTWVSASAYITDGEGRPVALLGTDVDIDSALAVFSRVRRLGITFDLVAMALLVLLAVQYIVWRYNQDRREAVRSEMEGSVLRLNEELVRTDRMKSEFVQLASHELRGPVNAVNLAVSTAALSLDEKLDESERELLDIAASGSSRLVDLVNNLLDLTRLEAGDAVINPRETDLRTLMSSTVRLFEPMAGEKGLGIALEMPDGRLDAVVDPEAVLRVLENLVANAIKFTEHGGVDIALAVPDGRVVITVRDSGPGIPLEFQGEVFKKFSKLEYSGGDRQRGSGMGLALSKALVEALGGRIWFTSVVGSGTEFVFDIPRYPEPLKPDTCGYPVASDQRH